MNTYTFYSLCLQIPYFVHSLQPERCAFKPISKFEYLTTTSRFIDKTMLIKDFLDTTDDHNYNLLTCPTKFGKTSTIDMLRRFLEIYPDAYGSTYDKKDTDNYRLFTDPNITLNIAQYEDFVEQHQGEYPVLHLNFHIIPETAEYDMLVRKIGRVIWFQVINRYFWLCKLLRRRKYATENQTLAIHNQTQIFWDMHQKHFPDEHDIVVSLNLVASLLHEYFGKKVIVLINKYDRPVMDAIHYDIDVQRIHNLLYATYHKLFQENSHVSHAFITGTLEIALPPIVKRRRFLDDHKFTQYYGLSLDERTALFNKQDPDFYPMYDDELNDVDIYYKCYHIRNTLQPLYNIYNMLLYSEDRRLFYSWERGASIRTICGLPSYIKLKLIRQHVAKLLVDNELRLELVDNTDAQFLDDYRNIVQQRLQEAQPHHVQFFFTCLFENGYFTHTGKENTYKLVNRGLNLELQLWLNYSILNS